MRACSLCYKTIVQFHQKCLLMRDCLLFRRLLLPESTLLLQGRHRRDVRAQAYGAPVLPEIAIRIGLLMGIVMISTTIKTALMMVEIAVDLMLIPNIAQNVCVMNKTLSINTYLLMPYYMRSFH